MSDNIFYQKQEVEIAPQDDDIRLDRWFARHYPRLPHALLESWLRRGDIRLNKARTKAGVRIKAGQILRIPPFHLAKEAPKKPVIISKALKTELLKRILFYDEDIIALDKPSGLAVQGGSKIHHHLDALLDIYRFDGERPRLVHRLDKDTSGVLLLARSAKMAALLTQYFRNHQVEKIYWALVYGTPKHAQGEIKLKIDGKPSTTFYRVVENLKNQLAWLEFQPISGRNHQIRIHAAHLGTPIIGDDRFSDLSAHPRTHNSTQHDEHAIDLKKIFGKNRVKLQLHARQLRLMNDKKFAQKRFIAPLPSHMERFWQKFDFNLDKSLHQVSY